MENAIGSWRLPTIEELKEAYKQKYKLGFKNEYYWSSSTSDYDSNFAQGVDFYFGNDYNGRKGNSHYVRCMRTINDTIEWYKCDAPEEMTWDKAIKYAESLNKENAMTDEDICRIMATKEYNNGIEIDKEISHSQAHYKKHKIEPIDVIEDYNLGFNLGNCIKYILRAEYKSQKESDLEKALWYLKREIEKGKE